VQKKNEQFKSTICVTINLIKWVSRMPDHRQREMSNIPNAPGYEGAALFPPETPAAGGSPASPNVQNVVTGSPLASMLPVSGASFSSSQLPLSTTLKSSFAKMLNDYEALTQELFGAIEENTQGKRGDRPPAEIMRRIVELDRRLQEGVSQSESFNSLYTK
jgi:hypothetical protein